MTAREQIAWAAGFIDGDGSFQASRSGQATIAAGQSSSNGEPEELSRMAEYFGGRVTGPYQSKAVNRQPNYKWSIVGFGAVQSIVAVMWPFLSQTKRVTAVRILREDRSNTLRPKKRIQHRIPMEV